MGLFNRKGKAKAEAAAVAKSTEQSSKPVESTPYKHVPRHAAADSMLQVGNAHSLDQIAMASQQGTLGSSSIRPNMALNMYHGMSSQSVPGMNPLYGGYGRRSSTTRSVRSSIFVTDPNAPPMPLPSPQLYKYSNPSRSGATSRAQSEYFGPQNPTGLYDGALDALKPAASRPDQDYSQSSDSGYGSAEPSTAAHSRAASEKNIPNDPTPHQHSRGTASISSDSATLAALTGSSHDKPAPRTSVIGSDGSPTPPPEAELQLSRTRTSSAGSAQSQGASSSSALPLSALEGYKINKRGMILDEEGELIGELVEGEIIDCVRKRVNAYGEVVDDFGIVVGIVRTVCPADGATGETVSTQEHCRRPSHVSMASDRFASPRRDASPPQTYVPTRSPSLLAATSATRCTVEETPVSPTTLPPPAQPSPPLMPNIEGLAAAPTPQLNLSTPAEPPRRSPRSSAERSLSDLSKAYVRPPMSSVPENNIAADVDAPSDPTLFSYKGIIPLRDGPPQLPVAAQARATPAYTMRPPLRTAKSAGPPTIPRHLATQSMSGLTYIRPGMSSRQSFSHPAKRSPLASHEATPNDSETDIGADEEGRFLRRSASRAASIRTTRTTMSTSGKSRTYFTHGGRITVEVGEVIPSSPKAAEVTPPAAEAEKTKKEKKRFTFGRRKSQAVAAH